MAAPVMHLLRPTDPREAPDLDHMWCDDEGDPTRALGRPFTVAAANCTCLPCLVAAMRDAAWLRAAYAEAVLDMPAAPDRHAAVRRMLVDLVGVVHSDEEPQIIAALAGGETAAAGRRQGELMNVAIVTRRFIACPTCRAHQHPVEQLFAASIASDHRFGPWRCGTADCNTEISGTVRADGTIDIEATEREPRGFSICKLRDLYLVLHETSGHVGREIADFFYHSHQCPDHLFRKVVAVYGPSGHDQHGMIRFIASAVDTRELRDFILSGPSLAELLARFQTDGEPHETAWPEEYAGQLIKPGDREP